MKTRKHTFSAAIWIYPGAHAQWHFVTVPKALSKDITEQYKSAKRGWGSLPVEVRIEKTVWKTSIFPDSKSGTYILPLKAAVRRALGIFDTDTVQITLVVCPKV